MNFEWNAIGGLGAAFGLTVAAFGVATAEESLPRASEVVVSASRVAEPADEVGSAVSVITAEDIVRLQARTVSDVLQTAPGVAVSRSGPTGSLTQVRMRGAEANQTLVLIDGMEVNDPSGGSEFDFANLLAADIERIEILRGPQSAMYGSDAIGGVINIVTRKGRGPATARLSVEAGSFGTQQGSVGVSGSGERYHYAISGTGFTTQGVSIAPEAEGNTEADGYRNQTYSARLGATLVPDLEIELTGRYVKSLIQTDSQPSVAGTIRTVDANQWTDTIQRTGRAQMTYTAFDGAWEQIVGAGYNSETSDSLTNGRVTYEADGTKTRFDYQSNVFFDTPSVAGAAHTVTFLAESENEAQVTGSSYGNTDLDITNYGLVGAYKVGLWDRLFLSASLRHDLNDIFDDDTTSRGTAAYRIESTGSRLHASYGTGAKNPTLTELYGSGPNFVPNPNLRPEKSRGWDAGIEQRLWGGKASVDLTYFQNRITDLIQGSGNSAVNLSGVSRIQGFETTARVAVTERIDLKAQYTFTDGNDAKGGALVRRPKHTVHADAGYRFLEDRAAVNLGVDYVGDQRDTEYSNYFGTKKAVVLDNHVLVGVNASYKVTETAEIYGRVENLLDTDYQNVLGYDNPGIGFYVGFRTALGLF